MENVNACMQKIQSQGGALFARKHVILIFPNVMRMYLMLSVSASMGDHIHVVSRLTVKHIVARMEIARKEKEMM
jgi:hypothetical protein